jgi:excisionase family DNA binding protein
MKVVCGRCQHLVKEISMRGEPPEFWCGNPNVEELVPPIGGVRGPDAPGCSLFVPLVALGGLTESNHTPTIRRTLTKEELFLTDRGLFVNVQTAADLLGKAPSTVYRLVSEGLIEELRSGATIYIYRQDILDFLRRKNGRR